MGLLNFLVFAILISLISTFYKRQLKKAFRKLQYRLRRIGTSLDRAFSYKKTRTSLCSRNRRWYW